MSASPNDYGIATDYRLCASCGTSRPVSALVQDGNPDGLRVCRDREWCEAQEKRAAIDALDRMLAEKLRRREAFLAPFATVFTDAVKEKSRRTPLDISRDEFWRKAAPKPKRKRGRR